ncbi:MAG: hypothetical protein AAB377_03035 [Patescibacteria group bacterium]
MKKWSDAHVFYSMFLHDLSGQKSSKIANEEQQWREWSVNHTPNGKLLVKNSFFDSLKNSSKMYLFHVTPNLKKIIDSGVIYSSGGCLVGSIYATPLSLINGSFKAHNLGEYIFKKEASRASYLKGKNNKSSIIIIEVDLPLRAHDNIIGIDYIKLGGVHLAIYKDLEYLLSFRERTVLQEILLNKIKHSLPYLNLVSNAYHKNEKIDSDDFFNLLLMAIDHLPILGYIYFEVIAEYLMLFQDGREAKTAHNNGEFYNAGYKDLMFDIFPDLLKGVGLGFFKPSFEQVVEQIKRKKLISKLNEKNFKEHLIKKIIFLTQARLLNNGEEYIDWCAFNWDFKTLESVASPLLGHLVHRELRNFGRFPDFYFYFDQFKALQAWNYWNHMDVVIPFNGVIPKGEIGINPAWPDLKIKAYVGREIKKPGMSGMYIEPKREIKIKIVPRLVDHRITIMRSKGRKGMQKIFGTFRD